MNSQRLASLFLLLGSAAGQTAPSIPQHGADRGGSAGALGDELARRTPAAFAAVLHDDPGSGVLWSVGADWKASFGTDGFTFIPFLGATAPRNFPVRFRVASVRVSGCEVPFAADARPTRTGDRVTFDRGTLREVYDLSLRQVEQTFVLDTTLAGDVTIELAVDSELAEDAAQPGLQFGNDLGGVDYGEAWLVLGREKAAIESTWNGRSIRLHVPANRRGAGPVVVDPVIATRQTTLVGTRPTGDPDIAYDATNDVYLVVWESLQAASDADIFCEMFDGDGRPIPGTGAALDASTLAYLGPRVANSNSANRFLVVVQRTNPGQFSGRSQIFGRTREAGGSRQLGSEFLISNPGVLGHHTDPDVGGDSGSAAGGLGWPVVWSHGGNDIWLEVVRDNGVPLGASRPIGTDPSHRLFGARISSSNGRGSVARPGWVIVYSATDTTGTNGDVIGRWFTASGNLSGGLPFETGPSHDLLPNVSSPATDERGTETWFLVTYERQTPLAARAFVFTPPSMVTVTTDLSQAFGFGSSWVRPESDGTRFAVTASMGSSRIGVATLAFDGNGLFLHEPPQVLPGFTRLPEIVSTWSGGGGPTRYMIAYLDFTSFPARPTVASYLGFASGPPIEVKNTACNGLSIQWDGLPLLGETMQFTLASFGLDVTGFALGFPPPNPIPLCSTCSLGVRPDRPIFMTFGSESFNLPIPRSIGLVNANVAVQGLAVGQGPCLGALRFSDTLNLTIR